MLKLVFAQLFLKQSCRKGLRKKFFLPVLKGVVCSFLSSLHIEIALRVYEMFLGFFWRIPYRTSTNASTWVIFPAEECVVLT